MDIHRNAKLTPQSRAAIFRRVIDPGQDSLQLFPLVLRLLRLRVQLSLRLQDPLLQSLRFLEPVLDLRPERRELPHLVQRSQESPRRKWAEAAHDLHDPLQHGHYCIRGASAHDHADSCGIRTKTGNAMLRVLAVMLLAGSFVQAVT